MDEPNKILSTEDLESEEAGEVRLEQAPTNKTKQKCCLGKFSPLFMNCKKTIKKIFGVKLSSGQRCFLKGFARVLGAILLILIILFGVVGFSAYRFYQVSKSFVSEANNLNVSGMKVELANTSSSLVSLKKSYKLISWLKHAPGIGFYFADTEHGLNALEEGFELGEIVLDAVEPHVSAGTPIVTMQEKLDIAVKVIPGITPKLGDIESKLINIQEELSEVDPTNYPEKLAEREIQSNVREALEILDSLVVFTQKGKPILEALPYFLGTDDERKFLVIFQNENELRPTGGFITAYTVATIKDGKFEAGNSDDIYDLDEVYQSEVEAPEQLIEYLGGPYLESEYYKLRDMNWNPDFRNSMDLFVTEMENAGIEGIDGVIAVDTRLLVYLIDAIGEIMVEGYGGYSNNIVELCDCEQIIYELEHFADREGPIVWSENEPGKIVFAPENYLDRKKIIGPMMNEIVSRAFELPNYKLPALFAAFMKSADQKHLLVYSLDEDVQMAVEEFGVSGKVDKYEGDYLHINDANLGGKKANLYVTQDVNQKIEIEDDGEVVKTVEITYKNPKPQDNWLNSVMPNYLRVYVPVGSELIEFFGVDETVDPYEEFEKSVFAGKLEVRPLGVTKVMLKYRLPFTVDDGVYKIFVQKQSGKDESLYTFDINDFEEEYVVDSDQEFEFEIK